MSDLHIPDAAYDAADAYLATKSDDQDALGAVDAAAPYIVAAELRRMAEIERAECESWRWCLNQCVPGGEAHQRNSAIYDRHFAAMTTLQRRAAELDGGAR